MTTASERIASFAVAHSAGSSSAEHRHLAYRALLDTWAVAMAGRREDAVRLGRKYLGEVSGIGGATDWDTGTRLPAEQAAWLNALMAHVLDYDDVMSPMRGHPSVSLVPALVALAEARGLSGRAYAEAYLVGFEVMAKMSHAMAIGHYAKGWHSTSALGVVGAAVACAVLLGLNEQQIVNAIGIAVSQAGGTRQNFGTMAKSFQAGQCAGAAVRAALLAESGFDASSQALDGPFGYMSLYAAKEDLRTQLNQLGTAPLEIDATGIDIKKYPCCYANHRALDAVLALRAAHAIQPGEVAAVYVQTNAQGLAPLLQTRPQTGLEGKFSMEYAMAAALYDGRLLLAGFADDQVQRAIIQSFFPKVSKQEAPGPAFPRWTEVTVRLSDGRHFSHRAVTARGDASDPLSDKQLVDKVADCLVHGRTGLDAQAAADAAFTLDSQNVMGFFGTVRRPAPLP